MANPTLQLKDGFSSESPDLRDDVQRLQRALIRAGFDLDDDGLFGQGTETAVKEFQRQNGLVADGIVGPKTWAAVDDVLEASGTASWEPPDPKPEEHLLEGFHGDLGWVHDREGHAGRTYWPGGASGVTLDPGVDLGHAKPSLIEAAYKKLVSPEQYEAIKRALGIKGTPARAALRNDPVLQSIRISRSQADEIFHFAAEPYWKAIVRRFPGCGEPDTPGSVQTVMLSLSYNRGAGNRRLGVLSDPIERKDWKTVADVVGNMQQDHSLGGIRKRRRMEGDLIRRELGL